MLKLKSFSNILASLFILTIIVVATALVIFSNLMLSATSGMGRTIESVRAAEEIEVHLLTHNRETFLLKLPDTVGSNERQEEALRNIRYWIDRARLFIDTPKEASLFKDAESAVEVYLASREQLNVSDSNAMESYLLANPYLTDAQKKVRDLIAVNIEQAERFQRQAASDNKIVNALGITVTLTCLFAFPLVWHLIRKWIYTPITNVHHMILKAKDGESTYKNITQGIEEIRQIGQALVELQARLDAQRKDQLHFLAGVAHDLKNPLNAIHMSAELLESGEIEQSEHKTLARIISAQSQSLDRMIGDFLDATRVEAGQLEIKPSPQNFLPLIKDAVLLHDRTSAVHRFEITSSDDSIACVFDPVRVSQVINNLLNNAIKYSPTGGIIKIGLAREGEEAVMSISDQGIGISPEDQKHIFEPFRRTQTTKATIPGVGLGLSVSRKIIQAHGGTIEVQSECDQGSTFIVRLPLLEAESKSQDASLGSSQSISV